MAIKKRIMKKIVMVAALGLVVLASCGEKKKDVCTCMKEATQIMIDKGFDVDPNNPEYPEGCKYMSEMTQEDIDKQIDDACRDEIMKMIFGDFNFDDMDMGDMEEMPMEDTDMGTEEPVEEPVEEEIPATMR